MADQRAALAAMDDLELETTLRDLSTALAFPSAGPAPSDIATRVRQRVVASPPVRVTGPLVWIRRRPIRRSLLVAVAALLILAAIAGAVGLGVPGIRIFFGGATPPATTETLGPSTGPVPSQPLGMAMGLGTNVSLDEAARIAAIDFVLPPDPTIGAPDAAYIFANRAALVWSERPGLPADPETGVGLLISQFHGEVDQGYYSKMLDSDAEVTPVTVNGNRGYWIGGPPHFFFYVDPSGKIVDDAHRVVGDTLIWAEGDITYRLESQLGLDEAIRLAESLR